MINILILSAGTRNKVVQYFRKELAGRGKVYATDCSELAPAVYEADEAILVPRMTDPGYLETILDICREKKITGVFSLIDPELTLLAEHREEFLAVGTTPIISSPEAVALSFDKYQMYLKLTELGFPAARCFMDPAAFEKAVEDGEMHYPVFIKPARGSASININKVSCREEAELLCRLNEDMMIQEFMDGTEYPHSACIKARPETIGFCGIIDIDIFKVNGKYYISEVNPRFGGGYPHAYACGVNVPAQIIRNLEGKANEEAIGAYEENICMMKYNEIMIRRMNDNSKD